ncbi:MAG: peptidylprolyl isomerase [candidate division Zixibacteria bacterium]|nr:peptidylprolyl isomerase [candidate division Zixibacteria bacterium]
MFRSIFSILLFVLFVFYLSHLGCGPPPKKEKSYLEDRLLAKVNEAPITLRGFHDFLKERRVVSTNDPEEDLKKKEEMLDKLIREILIDQKAFSFDWESDSSFVEVKNKYMNDFLLGYLRAKEITEKIQVTDEEIKDYYKQHKDEYYSIPEKRQIRRLLIKIRPDSTQQDYEKSLKDAEEKAKEKIEALYQRAREREDFADLVRGYSQDASRRDRSGKMGYLKRGELNPQLDSVAFSLEVGEISPPVRDERGYNLISVLDIKPKKYREFDEKVALGIKRFLEEEKTKEESRDYVEQLRKRTKFVYHEQILDQPDSLVEEDDWALIINDQDTIKFGDYASGISWYKLNMGKDSLMLEDRKDFLRSFLAVPIILVREAEKKGFRDSIEYQMEEEVFIFDEARKRVEAEKFRKDFPPPTREELETYYQAHKIDYPPLGVPVHVYHIIFDDSLEAVEVLNHIRGGADFVKLAKKYYPGEPEIKDVVYDLGFITQDEMPQNFYEKALSLELGEVSEPVKTEWGFHLIKVVEKKKEGKTFQDIIPEIEKDLKWKKIREYQERWEESLYGEAEIWIDQELLKEFQLDKPEG